VKKVAIYSYVESVKRERDRVLRWTIYGSRENFEIFGSFYNSVDSVYIYISEVFSEKVAIYSYVESVKRERPSFTLDDIRIQREF
jgi:hypothetical protein